MNPGEAYWLLVRPIWNAVSISNGPEKFNEEFAEAPLIPRTLFALHWCQSEVCNGGFHQFFWNSTGVLAPEAAIAFETIGMPKTASLVKQGMDWFDNPYPRQTRTRRQKLTLIDRKTQFRGLDDEFFLLWRSENGGFLKAADAYALSS